MGTLEMLELVFTERRIYGRTRKQTCNGFNNMEESALSRRYRIKVSYLLIAIAIFTVCCLDVSDSFSEENKPTDVDQDAILEAYVRQRNLLKAVDITYVFSGDLLVDKHIIWEQYGITSFRQGEDRFAFKGIMRRLDQKKPRSNAKEILTLPRPSLSPEMTKLQREIITRRQKVYDQIKKNYEKSTPANIKLEGKMEDGNVVQEVVSTIYNGQNVGRIFEGQNISRAPEDFTPTPEIYGPDQLELVAAAFQSRFFLFWGMHYDDPTLSETVKHSQKVVSLPDVINDKRMSLRMAELKGDPMILLEGVSGLESLKGISGGDRCWLDPSRDYILTRREFFDTSTKEIKSRIDFDDYKLFENGLWLPLRITYTRFGLPIGSAEYIGKPILSEILEVTSAKLNEDVTNDVFEIRFPAGKKVYDFEHGTDGQPIEYISGGGAGKLLVGRDKKAGNKLLWLVVANAIVGLIIIFLVLNRRKHSE